MEENRLSSTSKTDSDEKIGEFWDGHGVLIDKYEDEHVSELAIE